jgi:uncharacterized protein
MAPAKLHITVAYSPKLGEVLQRELTLEPGASAAAALARSNFLQDYPRLQTHAPSLGIWGKRCTSETLLRDQDRVEIYRPLTIDPKEARRLRQRSK